MTYLLLGFFTGLSLIVALGAQNIFVIEQGLKKQFVFTVCLICSVSDLILIFLGIFLFSFFKQFFIPAIELILNILLLIFLIYFIFTKFYEINNKIIIKTDNKKNSFKTTILKTLGFTYLNPHVYSDTVFFLGNFSKNLSMKEKFAFGIGASISSFLFFFMVGYLSKLMSSYLLNDKIWKNINYFIIIFMSLLVVYILYTLL